MISWMDIVCNSFNGFVMTVNVHYWTVWKATQFLSSNECKWFKLFIKFHLNCCNSEIEMPLSEISLFLNLKIVKLLKLKLKSQN